MRNYQARVHDMQQLERLHELQQQGLIHVQTGELTQEQYDKYNNRLLNRLAHLHLSSLFFQFILKKSFYHVNYNFFKYIFSKYIFKKTFKNFDSSNFKEIFSIYYI